MANFQKRHYEAIAATLRQSEAPPRTIKAMADMLGRDNPLFKPARFYIAAGFMSEPHTVGTDEPTPENDPVGRFRKNR